MSESNVAEIMQMLRYDVLVKPEVDAFLKEMAGRVKDRAVATAPRASGALARSGYARRINEETWQVGFTAPHATWVHQGSPPHWPPAKPFEAWAEAHAVDPFLAQRAIARGTTSRGKRTAARRGRPFLRRARSYEWRKVDKDLRKVVRNAEATWRRGGRGR